MRKLLIAIFVGFIFASVVFAQTSDPKAKAKELFGAGDYQNAIEILKKVASGGKTKQFQKALK